MPTESPPEEEPPAAEAATPADPPLPSGTPVAPPPGPAYYWTVPVAEEPAWRARSVIGRSLDTLGAALLGFVALALPGALLSGAAAVVVAAGDIALTVALEVVAGFVVLASTVLMIRVTDSMWSGRQPTFGIRDDTVARDLVILIALYLLLALVTVLVGVAVVAVALVVPILGAIVGIALLPVFVYVLIRLTPLGQVVVLERVSGLEAFRRSWSLTGGQVWRLFRVLVLGVVVALPITIGAQLLASYTTVPLVAAIAAAVGTVFATPLLAISTTLAWAELTERTYADSLVARGRGRRLAFSVILVGGILLGAAGIAESIRTGGTGLGLGSLIPDRGVILAGSAANPVDPCRPTNAKTEFAVGEPIHIGGYFDRRVPPGQTFRIEYYVDGELAVAEDLDPGPLGSECYYEFEPLLDMDASDWRVVVIHAGDTVAEGTFSIR